jgi:hypothetical protein
MVLSTITESVVGFAQGFCEMEYEDLGIVDSDVRGILTISFPIPLFTRYCPAITDEGIPERKVNIIM